MNNIHQLPNGLTVILREVHSAPVISFWIAYQIGSRNEPTGHTGMSHWVEHMLFKGTDRFAAGVLDREIDRAGGLWNAFTSTDYTMYYATLPAERIDLALAAEADRMVNAKFLPDEFESERTVIISERQGSENSPIFWLMEEVRGAAYRVHGYHHDIIGDMVDLHSIARDDLYYFYQRHYVPSNATIVAVGAFDSKDMLAQIEQHFGAIPQQPKPELFLRPEPPQQGERRVQVEQAGRTAFLTLAHHVPPATHDDWFKLEVLDSILTGPTGGLESKTCRLYKSLIKSGIAASVNGGLSETVDPFIYTITVTLNDGYEHEQAEALLLAAIERLQNEAISQQELDKAKKQARAAFAYSTESVTNQAYWLAQSAMLGDVTWYDTFLERLNRVTIEDVQDVARRYLIPRQRIVGYFVPLDEDDD